MMAEAMDAAQLALAAEQAANKRNRLLSTPALVLITLFGIGPLILILIYSFLKAAPYGGVEWKFSTDAYLNFTLSTRYF
jgi:spermidine/putrescine transport system permease protein